MLDKTPSTVALTPDRMRVHGAFGDRATFLLTGEQTGGRYCVFLLETPPGGGPPPHRHEGEDEWFHVLEGRAEFLRDGEWVEVPAGSAVFAPRGSVHAFRNVGDTVLRQVIQTAPAGFEDFFAALEKEFQRDGGPDMERVGELSAEFGIFYE
jgi:quercetin dioxygenase-like cupin family protein